jgi:uncharacterized protein with HEPN domain
MPRDIRLYLDDMLEAIRAIREYTGGMTFESFASDRKTIDAVVRNLEIIGEAARNLPEEVKDKSGEIEWRKIIGLRNLLIHEYFGISKPVVWDIVQNKLDLLEKFCSNQLRP